MRVTFRVPDKLVDQIRVHREYEEADCGKAGGLSEWIKRAIHEKLCNEKPLVVAEQIQPELFDEVRGYFD